MDYLRNINKMHANNATKSLALPMLLLNINNISMIFRNKTIAAK
jgi:hypothetical protein